MRIRIALTLPRAGGGQTATSASCVPRSVVEVACSTRDVDELARLRPSPAKLTVVLRRVRPRRSGRVGAGAALDEHLLDAADAGRVPLAPRSAG